MSHHNGKKKLKHLPKADSRFPIFVSRWMSMPSICHLTFRIHLALLGRSRDDASFVLDQENIKIHKILDI